MNEINNTEYSKLLAKETLNLEITEKIIELMQKENITKSELAERLGKSKEFVSQFLQDITKFNIETVFNIFYALGYEAGIAVIGRVGLNRRQL